VAIPGFASGVTALPWLGESRGLRAITFVIIFKKEPNFLHVDHQQTTEPVQPPNARCCTCRKNKSHSLA